jgi:4-hydroxybenzoate polyprenyltransferase
MFTKLIRTFVFGNIFVAFCAYFITTQELFFDAKISLVNPAALLVFFSTLLIYNYRKLLFGRQELSPPFTERSQWIVSNRSLLAIICLCSVFGILISCFSLKGSTFLFLIPFFFVSVLYATPLSTQLNSTKRLRHLPFVKIFLVAGVWSAVTVLFPALEYEIESIVSPSLLFTFSTRFLFLFAITLPFDLRDMEADRQNNIKTFPLVLGEKKTIQLAIVCLLLFCLCYLLGAFVFKQINPFKACAYCISGLIAIGFVSQSEKQKSEYFVSFWIEGLMLVQFILLFIFKHLQ